MNKYHNILEFNKILDMLKKYIVIKNNLDLLDNYTLYNTKEEIEEALNEVDEANKLILRYGRFPLYYDSNIAYFLSITNKAGILQVEQLLEVEKFLDTIKNIQIYLSSLKNLEINCEYFERNISNLIYPKELNLRIKEIITPYGEICDNASSNLKDIRRKIKESEKNIQNKLHEILNKNASKLTQAVISIRNDRYVIPVKNDFKNTVKGIIHDQSSSGETVYIEPLIICELNNKLNSLREDEKREIYVILKGISEQINEHYYSLIEDSEIIEKLDLIFAKANLSIQYNGAKPQINEDNVVEMYNCYHPLLQVTNIVKNNIIVGKDYQGVIITGPNTGGKTVLMKTIGLLAIMVKFGLLLPCNENSNIMIFDNIYADIGDEQSISQNLSTFSAHMSNVIEIINNVSDKSLVLLDELGSGTDPSEGSSLAIAVFDYLLSKKCIVIASSHYSELKIHGFESKNIINASVEFNNETLKPTYKLLMGVPGMSNALNICRMLGLSEEVINNAVDHVHNNDNKLNITLDKLVNQSHELDKKIQTIDLKQNELNQLIEKEKSKLVEIDVQKKKIIEKAEIDAKQIITNSRKRIDDLILELEELKSKEIKQHEIADLKHELKTIINDAHIEEEHIDLNHEITIGDNVYVENYGCYGTVTKINKNGKYEIQTGIAKLSVEKKYLKLTNVTEAIKPSVKASPIVLPKNVSMRLDLRGERYEDAAIKLEKYIDDAICGGLNQVSIIHGFGTGAIRELVLKFAKTNSNVESFRFGGQNEGGQGVTIITLKK